MSDTEKDLSSIFVERVKQYLSTNKVCVCILTPHYGGMCHVTYMNSLISTMQVFIDFGIGLIVECCNNDSLVSRARNNLVAKAMCNPNVTHILFIDNDITWSADSILKLILADKPIVGGIYPLKKYNWNNLESNPSIVSKWIDNKKQSVVKDSVSDVDLIQHRMLSYNLNVFTNTLKIENNLTVVKHIATGFMMIKRKVIEKMQQAYPSTKYVDDIGFLTRPEENEQAYALFDCGVEDGHYLSEDWLFCNRWTKLGGSIHVDITINLNHTGTVEFKGCYLSTIM
jgi:hypothetical protein